MKNYILFKTNALVCGIILIGFLITAVLSYRANISSSLKNIEQVSQLTSEGIYYQLTSIFTRPVNVSLTMANDSLLKVYLSEEKEHLQDEEYVGIIREYLSSYKEKYNYDSVFLISTQSGRYYNFNGVNRLMTPDNEENIWYFDMLESQEEYSLNVDNDEVENAEDAITIFVNCKIKDKEGNVIGLVGVGQEVKDLQSLLKEYESKFGVKAFLINNEGSIEVSTEYTGYEKVNLFEVFNLQKISDQILNWREEETSQSVWLGSGAASDKNDFLVYRYIKELSWHLVVERNTSELVEKYQTQLLHSILVIITIIIGILFVITHVVKSFNRKITDLTEEKDRSFRKATEQLYGHIHEYNITNQKTVGESTKRALSYHEVLDINAAEMREEFREGYFSMFNAKNILKEYEEGNTRFRYDFEVSNAKGDYEWIRIEAYIYYQAADACVYMLTYRKNINEEKIQEKNVEKRAQTDEMTGLYNKTATQKEIERILSENKGESFGFFIFDIDNFKQANDIYGHAFGDSVIVEFTDIIKSAFQEDDLLGRVGGDEFVAFVRAPEKEWLESKAKEVSLRLNKTHEDGLSSWMMASSIGIAAVPEDGDDFDTLYKKADAALYQTKERGKNGYTIWRK